MLFARPAVEGLGRPGFWRARTRDVADWGPRAWGSCLRAEQPRCPGGVSGFARSRQPALARLVRLDREHKILNKDILSLDMRIEGRATARLSEEAHAARVEKLTRKPVKARASET